MLPKPLKTCSLLLLLIYGMYTLSPNYATLPGPAAGKRAGVSSGGVKVRILWVGVLLESLLEDVQDAGCAGIEQVAATPQDEDLLLIRKKRAVNSRPFTVLPPPRPLIAIISVDDEQSPPVPVSYDVPRDLLHCRADCCFSLKAGLSPPPVSS